MKKRIWVWFLVFCLAAVQTPLAALGEEKAVGAVMRLALAEGAVAVESQNGKAQVIRENMKLYSGNMVSTEQASYAYVSLDEVKAVKLDALSKAQVRKSGKKLELLLESGNLFFNVKEPLKEDESLNIRTSTMVTGIRGTVGIVSTLDNGVTSVCLLEGRLLLMARDPLTGETRQVDLQQGQKALIASGKYAGGMEYVEIYILPLTREDIDGFAAQEIAKDENLRGRIEAALGSEFLFSGEEAEHRLVLDQKDMAEAMGGILSGLSENVGAVDPVFKKDDGSSSGGGGNGGGSYNPPAGGAVVIGDDEIGGAGFSDRLADAFTKYDRVELGSGTGGTDSGRLSSIGEVLSVPFGKTLSVNTNLDLAPGSAVTVDGTLEIENNMQLTNRGTITNNGNHTLHIKKDSWFSNAGQFVNNGRTLIEGTFMTEYMGEGEEPSFLNQGTVVNHGRFQTLFTGGGQGPRGLFINASTGAVENHGIMQVSATDHFRSEAGARCFGSDGIYYLDSSEGSPQDLKAYCDDKFSAGFVCVKATGIDYINTGEQYAAGQDLQTLLDNLDLIYLIEDLILENEILLVDYEEYAWKTIYLDGYGLELRNASIVVNSDLWLYGGNDITGGKNRVKGSGTNRLIEVARGGFLEMDGVLCILESGGSGGEPACTIFNRGEFRAPTGMYTATSIENNMTLGWAFANVGGVIKNQYGAASVITLRAAAEGYTLNLAQGDEFESSNGGGGMGAPAEESGGVRELEIPGDSQLVPSGSLDRPAILLAAEVLEPPVQTATASNAARPAEQETEDFLEIVTPSNAKKAETEQEVTGDPMKEIDPGVSDTEDGKEGAEEGQGEKGSQQEPGGEVQKEEAQSPSPEPDSGGEVQKEEAQSPSPEPDSGGEVQKEEAQSPSPELDSGGEVQKEEAQSPSPELNPRGGNQEEDTPEQVLNQEELKKKKLPPDVWKSIPAGLGKEEEDEEE